MYIFNRQMVRRRFGFHVREQYGLINPRFLWGDLTRTFGGLIIMAHRVNSQSLYVIPFIHILLARYLLYRIINNNDIIINIRHCRSYGDFPEKIQFAPGIVNQGRMFIFPIHCNTVFRIFDGWNCQRVLAILWAIPLGRLGRHRQTVR